MWFTSYVLLQNVCYKINSHMEGKSYVKFSVLN